MIIITECDDFVPKVRLFILVTDRQKPYFIYAYSTLINE